MFQRFLSKCNPRTGKFDQLTQSLFSLLEFYSLALLAWCDNTDEVLKKSVKAQKQKKHR